MHDTEFYGAILNALSDQQTMSIINCTSKDAKSMNEIIKETSISRTTVHRKINSMIQNKLLGVENFIITSNGKKSRLFRSRVNSIKVQYEGDIMSIIVEENPHVQSKISLISKTSEEDDKNLDNNYKESTDLDYLLAN